MDEGKTLDFNDLMDVGDEFPGFEIAKFTPANESISNDDGVLRTPTHEQEDEDYLRSDSGANVGTSGSNDTSVENSDSSSSNNENMKAEVIGADLMNINENKDESLKVRDGSVQEINGETSGAGPDVDLDASDSKGKAEISDQIEEINDKENDDGEPVNKKKKLYLKPPRPKMQLWCGNKQQKNDSTNNDVDENKSSSEAVEESSQDVVVLNGEEECEKKDGEKEEKVEEEDPHQQSFLSFLNLKPGSSKPKEDQRNEEESQKQAFYSRKRLRTRKKVSYYEDVSPDDDDEYNIDDDEDEDLEDHVMESSGRNRNNRARSRTNSKSSKVSGVTNYTTALQNLLPGVDLSCLKQTPPQSQKPVSSLPKIGPKSFMNSLANSSIISTPGNLKGLFECGLCGTFFNTASQFITHQEAMHSNERKTGRSAMETFRCEICGFVLTNRFAYQEHKRMKHNKSGSLVFNCSKCKLGKFSSLAALQKHQLSCGSPFCSTCGATFNAWVAVAEHRRKVHADIAPTRQWLNCVNKTCNFKCVTQHEMKQHVQQKHMLNELYTCNAPKCSRVFSLRDDLTEHKKEAHASEFIVQYQCMECKNCFSSKTLLAEHQYLHTLEKLRKCDLCSRHFSSIIELRKHKDVHAVKGSVRCQSCTRWCNDKLELVNHVCAQKRRTSGIRLYFCDVCHKDFRSDQKMFQHRKEHKNFFQCASCLWECTSESEYFKHRQTHGKYTCIECCEELDKKNVETHAKAHKYYIKMEDIENDGKNEKVMFLYPNLINVMKA